MPCSSHFIIESSRFEDVADGHLLPAGEVDDEVLVDVPAAVGQKEEQEEHGYHEPNEGTLNQLHPIEIFVDE